jgi:hypothetical protein
VFYHKYAQTCNAYDFITTLMAAPLPGPRFITNGRIRSAASSARLHVYSCHVTRLLRQRVAGGETRQGACHRMKQARSDLYGGVGGLQWHYGNVSHTTSSHQDNTSPPAEAGRFPGRRFLERCDFCDCALAVRTRSYARPRASKSRTAATKARRRARSSAAR